MSVIFLDISERLAFMFGDPVEKDKLGKTETLWAQSSVSFTGETHGVLTLSVPQNLCLEIAANILGVEPEELDDGLLGEDALRELLNVVAGHVVPALQSEDVAFELSVPVFRLLESVAQKELLQDPGTICYELEGSPVLLNMIIDAEIA